MTVVSGSHLTKIRKSTFSPFRFHFESEIETGRKLEINARMCVTVRHSSVVSEKELVKREARRGGMGTGRNLYR